ncbi:MAG: hypothetical protein COA32_09090 [Fluviicola sp.]|nr:MAG: hypothetical protein COA32_09090 [Fluviicola sp.]
MKQNSIYRLFFILLLMVACNSERSERSGGLILKDTFEIDIDTTSTRKISKSIDSVFLKKVQISYAQKTLLSNYRDSVNYDVSQHEYYSMVPTKFNLNGDEFDDYVVLYVGFHSVHGIFIDGFTGQKIPTSAPFGMEGSMFFSRPYPNEDVEGLDLQVVDVNCRDSQKELSILFSAGNPPGTPSPPETYLILYRYNKSTSKVNMIFSELVMEFFSTPLDTIPSIKANYIDILYDSIACFNEINVFPGEPTVYSDCSFNFCDDWRKAKIKPRNRETLSRYLFNTRLNKFVKHSSIKNE